MPLLLELELRHGADAWKTDIGPMAPESERQLMSSANSRHGSGRRLERVLNVFILLAHKPRTMDELIEQTATSDSPAVSRHTIRRDFIKLEAAGCPVEYDAQTKTYAMPRGFLVPTTRSGKVIGPMLDQLSARLEHLGLTDRMSVRGAAQSTIGLLLPQTRAVGADERASIATLARAAHDRRVVRFEYHANNGSVSQRTVEVWGVLPAYHVYVVGFDTVKRVKRTFAVDGIRKLEVTPRTFARPDLSADDLARIAFDDLYGERISATIWFARAAARTAQRHPHPLTASARCELAASGDLYMHFTDVARNLIVDYVLSWGGTARLIAPLALVPLIRSAAQAVLDTHNDGTTLLALGTDGSQLALLQGTP
jgi:predicted DNA-binding transcriptional regulator YafY